MALKLKNSLIQAIIWSPIIQIVWLTFGVTICFLVAYLKKDVTIYMPFISETGAIIPEMGIFSTTLIFGSFWGVIIVLYRYGIVLQIATKEDKRIMKINNIAVMTGIISMAGLAGVAAFPMSTILTAHLVAAGIHFTLAVVYLFLQTYISLNVKTPYCSRFVGILRFALSILLLLFLVLLVIFFPISYVKWKKTYPDRPKASKTPEDEYFGVLVASAAFEWMFYSTFMTYTSTFMKEFRNFKPVFSVEATDVLPNKDTSTASAN